MQDPKRCQVTMRLDDLVSQMYWILFLVFGLLIRLSFAMKLLMLLRICCQYSYNVACNMECLL